MGTQLTKLDLQSAYRIVPIHPKDQHLLAIEWEGATYVDHTLPFGLRSAPKIFTAVADMVAWVLHCAGIQHQLHYIDDFLFLGAPDTGEGARALSIALEVNSGGSPQDRRPGHIDNFSRHTHRHEGI